VFFSNFGGNFNCIFSNGDNFSYGIDWESSFDLFFNESGFNFSNEVFSFVGGNIVFFNIGLDFY
jgi:hypothetical protein